MTNFLGSHAINMDAKGRLAIPARVREDLETLCGGRIVLTAHTEERCLLVYPEPQWEEILPKIEALPSFNKAVRRTQRLLIGYATPLELDGAGRILVPQPLRDYAGLEKKLYLVGQVLNPFVIAADGNSGMFHVHMVKTGLASYDRVRTIRTKNQFCSYIFFRTILRLSLDPYNLSVIH
mgnify:CR=1 FL=1